MIIVNNIYNWGKLCIASKSSSFGSKSDGFWLQSDGMKNSMMATLHHGYVGSHKADPVGFG